MADEKVNLADKAKAEAAEKAAAKAKADAEAQRESAAAEKAEKERVEAELKKVAEEEAERIANSDEGANTDDEYVGGKQEAARKAYGKLRSVALDFQRSTPDEHIIFGRAGVVFTLGDLRDLTNVRD